MDKSLILNKIIQYKNLKSDAEFARFLDITPQNFSKWKQRGTYDIELLYKKCPELNPEWLLTGDGSMLKSEEKSSINQNITGDSNIQSGNDTNTGDSAIQIKKLEQELKECKKELKEKDKTISKLVNLMSSK